VASERFGNDVLVEDVKADGDGEEEEEVKNERNAVDGLELLLLRKVGESA
jgi:hypothetical protein